MIENLPFLIPFVLLVLVIMAFRSSILLLFPYCFQNKTCILQVCNSMDLPSVRLDQFT